MYYSIFIEGGIFLSHGIWLIRTRRLRKEAKVAGKSFDDIAESEDYHVDVASRDIQKDQIEPTGSVALSKDLEKAQEIFSEPVSDEKSDSFVNPTKVLTVRVTEEEVGPEGVNALDYATMPHNNTSRPRTRPGYARQDSNVVTLNSIKVPQ